jgi:hypothetical protein
MKGLGPQSLSERPANSSPSGRIIRASGWAVFLLSICFWLSIFKTRGPFGSYFLFKTSIWLLTIVAAIYIVGWLCSAKWRIPAVQHAFCPWFLGAAGWWSLYLAADVMNRILNQ